MVAWIVVAGGGSMPAPGTAVTTVSLTSVAASKYNNQSGVVVTANSKVKLGRVAVLVDGAEKPISFKLINLRLVVNADTDADAGADADAVADETAHEEVHAKVNMVVHDKSAIDCIPDEIICLVFKKLDAKTLLMIVPQVCRRWRGVCQQLKDVHLDFRWTARNVPIQAMAGWRQDSGEGDDPIGCGNCYACVTGGSHPCQSTWVTGVCQLFPCATGLTLGLKDVSGSDTEDSHLIALVDGCDDGLKHVQIHGSYNESYEDDLTDAGVRALACKCPNLETVGMGWNYSFTDAAVKALAMHCSCIARFTFIYCANLTDAAVIAVTKGCAGIKEIDFRGCCRLTDVAVIAVADTFPDIQKVAFGGDENGDGDDGDGRSMFITDASLMVLADKCRGLTSVTFQQSDVITDAGIYALAQNCQGLKEANLYGCSRLTDASIVVLADKCRAITDVDLSWCQMLTDAAALALANTCKGITHICLTATDVGDVGVSAIANECRNIKHIDLFNCDRVTDVALIALADKCPDIETIQAGIEQGTDVGVIALARGCNKIKDANFCGCENLSDSAAIAMAENCPELYSINFVGCEKLTDAAVLALAAYCPKIVTYGQMYSSQVPVIECEGKVTFIRCPNVTTESRVMPVGFHTY